jgi:hypothetical protein
MSMQNSDINKFPEWIKENSEKYLYIRSNVVSKVFPNLNETDTEILTQKLVWVINLICFKFGFLGNDKKDPMVLWYQLLQNNMRDIRGILYMLLPHIINDEDDNKKRKLRNLEDIYLETDKSGMPIYTNAGINRCVRHRVGDDIVVFKRPFLIEYLNDSTLLLGMSIDMVAHKLYVNWVDILPIRMDEYHNTKIYHDTLNKIVGKIVKNDDGTIKIEHKLPEIVTVGTIDFLPGLSYQDFYNTISNLLYHRIKNCKWLIYDIPVTGKLVPLILYLENRLNVDSIWNNLSWSQIGDDGRNKFKRQWVALFNSNESNDNLVLHYFYFFFAKYHENSEQLIAQKKLVLTGSLTDPGEEDEENIKITDKNTKDARLGLSNIPIDELYLFLYNQLSTFQKTWYYYVLKIKKIEYLIEEKSELGITIRITPKNIYNYCKSMVHYQKKIIIGNRRKKSYVSLPKFWASLKDEYLNIVVVRLLDMKHSENDWTKDNWFNINRYIRRFYGIFDRKILPRVNYLIHKLIRTQIVSVVFETLIYHGILSEFVPKPNITNETLVKLTPDDKPDVGYQRSQIAQETLSEKNKEKYEKYAYYYLTGKPYGDLAPLLDKKYPPPSHKKSYFDVLTSEFSWQFVYAMNWINQINFYHHYLNNRVIYVTGATGVGKSTQTPKLLLYAQKMLDYNYHGKIVCTQPRIEPVIANANTISRELGVPIREYHKGYDANIYTNNYYVQYKYSEASHAKNTESFLRIVTDGILLNDLILTPFLTKSISDKYAIDKNGRQIEWARIHGNDNIYDAIIVDEAHEHNTNMDMILTLARSAIYINNSIKLIIVSATIDDDEPIYRRYYRIINDNRAYPLNAFIEINELDRSNVDRRIHMSEPGRTTKFKVNDHYLTKDEASLINKDNYVDYGIKKTVEIANKTSSGDILLFLAGEADIHRAVKEINAQTPANIIAFGFYAKLSEEYKVFIREIHSTLSEYTRYKDDIFLEEKNINRRVPKGTYNRAIIIATNVAEASITLVNLRYVVDTGYAKISIYDPIDGTTRLSTLPISYSSSIQRRGRVGRVAQGDVFYLYDKDKVRNNKIPYQIANSNIRNLIVSLIKTEAYDPPIITQINDINSIKLLKQIESRKGEIFGNEYLVYDILKNPRVYMDIIVSRYLYMPDATDINQYYTYYGKTDRKNYDFWTLEKNLKEYFTKNHDDYHYQEEDDTSYFLRTYTGYESFVLDDQKLQFYLIHPDENIIERNLYTGKMKCLRMSNMVSDAYYYYLLKYNKIPLDKNERTYYLKNFNYNNFVFLKYLIAITDAQQQMLVLDVPVNSIDIYMRYTNQDQYLQTITNNYYDMVGSAIYGNKFIATIRSNIHKNISIIEKKVPLRGFKETNNLLWYAYGIPYDIQDDIFALINMIETVPDLGQWIHKNKGRKDITSFFITNLTEQGDIYFLWLLWNAIKEILEKNRVFDKISIGYQTYYDFVKYKSIYLSKGNIPYDEFLVFDKLYKTGKLDTNDEFYHYIYQKSMDFKNLILNPEIRSCINDIAQSRNLNPKTLSDFIVTYLNDSFELAKNLWIYKYQSDNKLQSETIESDKMDVIKWIKKRLKLPGINNDPNHQISAWDRIFEAYLRAFSVNLVKNEYYYYLKVSRATPMDPAYWSKNFQLEKTFLKAKTDYLIFHHYEIEEQIPIVFYLTPVKLEWIINLNPIYYFYLYFDKKNILYQLDRKNEYVNYSIRIINESRHLFNITNLLAYLDRLGDPTITKIIRKELLANKENKN